MLYRGLGRGTLTFPMTKKPKKTKVASEWACSNEELRAFEVILRAAKVCNDHRQLGHDPEVRAALITMGTRPTARVTWLIIQFQNGQVSPLHLGLFRRLAASPMLSRRLCGDVQREFLLDLAAHWEVYRRLTAAFFQSTLEDVNEAEVWYGAEALHLALQKGLVKVGRINSAADLLRLSSTPAVARLRRRSRA